MLIDINNFLMIYKDTILRLFKTLLKGFFYDDFRDKLFFLGFHLRSL